MPLPHSDTSVKTLTQKLVTSFLLVIFPQKKNLHPYFHLFDKTTRLIVDGYIVQKHNIYDTLHQLDPFDNG